MSDLLDVAESAAYLNTTERWVRRAIFENRLPYVKLGALVRLERSALDELIERGRQPASFEHA